MKLDDIIRAKRGLITIATLKDGCKARIEDRGDYCMLEISDHIGVITKKKLQKRPADELTRIPGEHITITWSEVAR